jgi:pimeloyl-ACP methyl ester carboxylesterase
MTDELLPFSKSTNVRVSKLARTIGLGLSGLDLIAPRLATRATASLFLTPRRVARPQRESEWCATARRELRVVAGLEIAVWSWGEGEPVLLLHGWEGRGSQLGAFVEPLLAAGYSVVAPDQRAHGDSKGRRTNLLEFAAITGALIDELSPAAIIAHYFGAAATNVALRDRDFDGRIVYVAPPEDFEFFTESFGATLRISRGLAFRMQHEIESRFAIDWSKLRGAAIAPAMSSPLLVIHDRDDAEVPVRYGRALAAAWPRASFIETEGLGHRRILRSADVVEAGVAFITREAVAAAALRG